MISKFDKDYHTLIGLSKRFKLPEDINLDSAK